MNPRTAEIAAMRALLAQNKAVAVAKEV